MVAAMVADIMRRLQVTVENMPSLLGHFSRKLSGTSLVQRGTDAGADDVG